MRRATWLRCWQLAARDISIHALLAESDNCTSIGRPKRLYFYPRSPCGERRQVKQTCRAEISISIHALLAESDRFMAPLIFNVQPHFYPRSPCGERRGSGAGNWPLVIFLSTLSLRRATPRGGLCYLDNIISIHALLAESDGKSQSSGTGIAISIHALLAESDRCENCE